MFAIPLMGLYKILKPPEHSTAPAASEKNGRRSSPSTEYSLGWRAAAHILIALVALFPPVRSCRPCQTQQPYRSSIQVRLIRRWLQLPAAAAAGLYSGTKHRNQHHHLSTLKGSPFICTRYSVHNSCGMCNMMRAEPAIAPVVWNNMRAFSLYSPRSILLFFFKRPFHFFHVRRTTRAKKKYRSLSILYKTKQKNVGGSRPITIVWK